MQSITIARDDTQPFSTIRSVRQILKKLGHIATQGDNIEITLENVTNDQSHAVLALLHSGFLFTMPNIRHHGPARMHSEQGKWEQSIPGLGIITATRDEATSTSTISLPAYDGGALPVHHMEEFVRFIENIFPTRKESSVLTIPGQGHYLPIAFPDVAQAQFTRDLLSPMLTAQGHGGEGTMYSVFEGIPELKHKPLVLIREDVLDDIRAKELGQGRPR